MNTANRTYTVRRLFRNDLPLAEKCFSHYDFLHFNPVSADGLDGLMASGQLWAIFHGDEIVAATWLAAGDSSFYRGTTAFWEINDLLDNDGGDYMMAGYIWHSEKYADCPATAAFDRLWMLQAAEMKKTRVVHCYPRHINADMGRLFENGWKLIGLRGLDKLVPHYIFVKKAELKSAEHKISRNVKYCPLSDTKQLSKLCEHGYRGCALTEDNKILFTKGADYYG